MTSPEAPRRRQRRLRWVVACVLLTGIIIAIRMALFRPEAPPQVTEDRVVIARSRCEKELRAAFTKAGVRWPADEIFLRGLKRERQLELWARDREGESFRLVRAYPILAQSGGPGPKRREGDRQVPEGSYEVDRFNPLSAFHLSLGLNYPNASDIILGDPVSPGFDIFIHGGEPSIGCLALGDPAMGEIYLAALDSRARPIRVHIFPGRIDAPDWPAWRDSHLADQPGWEPLWAQCAEAWTRFAKDGRVPIVEFAPDGGCRIQAGK